MAAMARLDGEAPALTPEQVDAHIAGCDACQHALAGLTTLHTQLNRVDYDHLDMDFWPIIHQRVAPSTPRRPLRESWAIVGLAVVLGAWRLAQLLVELPAPVVNSVVPLVLIVLVLRQLTGDPFAIRVASRQLQREGTS
jgi:anti-sigma factor RsiW